MTTYTFNHTSRNLVVGNSSLYLAGDDLVTRNLVILESDLGGRANVKAYSLNPKNLLLANVPHIGKFSQRTFTNSSRMLIEERSTLKGILTGSALFPEIVPSQVQFKPARYIFTKHYVQSGELELHLWADSNAGATLQLDYSNVTDTTAETVMSLWDSVYGTYKFLRLPRAVLAGVKQELAEYMLKGGDKAKWFFAEAPKWDGRLKGYGDLKVTLVSKITTLPTGEASNTGSGSTVGTGSSSGNNTSTTVSPTVAPTWMIGVSDITYSNGNATITATATNEKTVRSFASKSSGKWYAEMSASLLAVGGINSVQDTWWGVAANASMYPGFTGTNGIGITGSRALLQDNLSATLATSTLGYASGSARILMIAVDFDAKRLWFGSDGTWLVSGNPVAGTGASASGWSGTPTWYIVFRPYFDGDAATLLASPTYTPSGFTAWTG